jgi:hypothetical protein
MDMGTDMDMKMDTGRNTLMYPDAKEKNNCFYIKFLAVGQS